MLINIQPGLISPPFGTDCYVMKGVLPFHIDLADVFQASLPFFVPGTLTSVLVMFVPQVALWPPSFMM
jgi:TRAP-type C4-dicarboxylate transport system permease large subunit